MLTAHSAAPQPLTKSEQRRLVDRVKLLSWLSLG